MKKDIRLLAVLMALLAAFVFTSCDGGAMSELWDDNGNRGGNSGLGAGSPSSFTVSFDVNGHGTAPAQQSGLPSGGFASAPDKPRDFGYVFGGWYKEAGCTNEWDFASDAVTENTTLYAKWTIAPFTVDGSGKKVLFSQGNMYWDGNENKYKMESNQYDFRHHASNTNDSAVIDGVVTTTPSNTVGSFFWVKTTETAVNPYDASYGTPAPADTISDTLFAYDGGAIAGWTVLSGGASSGEWEYLFSTRTCVTSGMGGNTNVRYAFVKINGVKGIIVFPDTFTWTSDMGTVPTTLNNSCADYGAGNYDVTQFEAMEDAGVVFLSACGTRSAGNVSNANNAGYYQTCTKSAAARAYHVYYSATYLGSCGNDNLHKYARSIRLVKEITP